MVNHNKIFELVAINKDNNSFSSTLTTTEVDSVAGTEEVSEGIPWVVVGIVRIRDLRGSRSLSRIKKRLDLQASRG